MSKRFSVTDKRDMATLIAIELEMVLSECKHETELVQAELDDTTAQLRDLERKSRHVFTALRDFARSHEAQLTSHAHDLTTTGELVRQMKEMIKTSADDSSALSLLHTYLCAFLRQVRLTMRPSYRPHYASCPSVCPSVSYGIVTRKQKKNVETSELVYFSGCDAPTDFFSILDPTLTRYT